MARRGNKQIAFSLLQAQAKQKRQQELYGDNPELVRSAGVASLIGADIIDGFNQKTNAELAIQAHEANAAEIDSRAKVAVAHILSQGEKVKGAQTTAYAKSGVKLEGSAIDVLDETARHAFEAARIKRREADFEIGKEEIGKAVAQAKSDFAVPQMLLNIATSVASNVKFGGSDSVSKEGADFVAEAKRDELMRKNKTLKDPLSKQDETFLGAMGN